MPLDVTELTPGFCAEVGGVDITKPIAPAVFREIRDAFDTYSVLVFRDQPMDDDTQVAFSRYFGVPEIGGGANPAAGTPFSRQSNLDIKTGDIIPTDDRRMALPKREYALAYGQFVQGGLVSVLHIDCARSAAGGRQYRVRVHPICL